MPGVTSSQTQSPINQVLLIRLIHISFIQVSFDATQFSPQSARSTIDVFITS